MKRNWSEGQLEWIRGIATRNMTTCSRCGLGPMLRVRFLAHAKQAHPVDWDNYWSIPPTTLSISDEILNQEEVL